MSFWSRITYAFRGDRLNHEIDEEFAAHIEEAMAAGDDPTEVRRAFGSQLRLREQSHDARIVSWLDCLRADQMSDSALIDALLEIAEVNPSELMGHRLLSGRAKASDLGRPSHFAPPR